MGNEFIGSIILTIATLMNLIAYIPQIVKSVKTKHTDDISTTSWVIWISSATCGELYALFFQDNIMLKIDTSASLAICFTMLAVTIIFQKNEKS